MKRYTCQLNPFLKKIIFLLLIAGVIGSIVRLAMAPPSEKWLGIGEGSSTNRQISQENVTKKNGITTRKRETVGVTVEPSKTLWDWMTLVVAPATLAILGIWIQTSLEQTRDKKDKEERDREEKAGILAKQQAQDEQREDALEAYLSNMSNLLVGQRLSALAKEWAKGPFDDEKKQNLLDAGLDVIRARTLSILRRLTVKRNSADTVGGEKLIVTDGARKASVLLFLYEAELIQRKKIATKAEQENSQIKESLLSLNGADLTNADLSGVNLSEVNLSGADLSYAKLNHADLSRANLRNAKLIGAKLTDAILTEAILDLADLSRADLSNADLRSAKLNEAELDSAELVNAQLFDAELPSARLNCANLSSAHFNRAKLNNATLNDADLTRADFSDADLIGADLSHAKINDAYFSKTNLGSAKLIDSKFTHSHLVGAVFKDADLSNADLSYSDLSYADFSNAKLSCTDLCHAHLNGANLRHAYLYCAQLNHAHISHIHLSGAILLKTDLRFSKELTQQQLEREEKEEAPLLCSVDLPAGILVSRNRDCDLLPQELKNRYPETFRTIESAKELVTRNGGIIKPERNLKQNR